MNVFLVLHKKNVLFGFTEKKNTIFNTLKKKKNDINLFFVKYFFVDHCILLLYWPCFFWINSIFSKEGEKNHEKLEQFNTTGKWKINGYNVFQIFFF